MLQMCLWWPIGLKKSACLLRVLKGMCVLLLHDFRDGVNF